MSGIRYTIKTSGNLPVKTYTAIKRAQNLNFSFNTQLDETKEDTVQ